MVRVGFSTGGYILVVEAQQGETRGYFPFGRLFRIMVAELVVRRQVMVVTRLQVHLKIRREVMRSVELVYFKIVTAKK